VREGKKRCWQRRVNSRMMSCPGVDSLSHSRRRSPRPALPLPLALLQPPRWTSRGSPAHRTSVRTVRAVTCARARRVPTDGRSSLGFGNTAISVTASGEDVLCLYAHIICPLACTRLCIIIITRTCVYTRYVSSRFVPASASHRRAGERERERERSPHRSSRRSHGIRERSRHDRSYGKLPAKCRISPGRRACEDK